MSVNFSKHQSELQKVWLSFIKNNQANKWVLFGFEGKSTDLCVHSKGDDGIEELVEELSAGKIMYGCIWIKDPNSGLAKCVLIFWQGQGVPESIKGRIAASNQSIKNFFRGYNIDIVARSEDDLNIKDIEKKVASASGANYSYHKEKPQPDEPVTVCKQIPKKVVEIQKQDVTGKINSFKNKANEEQNRNYSAPKPVNDYKKPTPIQNTTQTKNTVTVEKCREEIKIKPEIIQQEQQQKTSNIEEPPKANANKLVKLFENKTNETKNNERPKSIVKNIRTQESNNIKQQEYNNIKQQEYKNIKPVETKNITPLEQKLNKMHEESSDSLSDNDFDDEKPIENIKDKRDFNKECLIQNENKEIKKCEFDDDHTKGERRYANVLCDFMGEDEQDISVRQNERIEILDINDDSLCLVRNSKGKRGLIPLSFIDIPRDDKNSSASVSNCSTPLNTYKTNYKVRVIAEYLHADTDEIDIYEDEIITIIDDSGPNWWLAINSAGHQGLVPSNYVDKNLEKSSEIQNQEEELTKEFYKALYDYEMDDDNELTMVEGEILEIKYKNEDGWWLVSNQNGEIGLVPFNYLEPYNS